MSWDFAKTLGLREEDLEEVEVLEISSAAVVDTAKVEPGVEAQERDQEQVERVPHVLPVIIIYSYNHQLGKFLWTIFEGLIALQTCFA